MTNILEIQNVKHVFKFTHKANYRTIYLVHGDCYEISSAQFYNHYTNNEDYSNFLDCFDGGKKLTKEWVVLSRKSSLESIVVMH